MTPKDIAVIITAIAVPCLMFLAGAIYHICEKIKAKRPHKSDDEEDNPITKFKDDLAEIYESNPNVKLKKLAQAVWNRVEEIEKWHDTEIKDIERRYYSAQCDAEELKDRCNKYNKELGEWYARYDNLKRKFEESQAQLRKAEEKAKTQPDYLIEKRFPGQINPLATIILNTNGEPLTATELSERLQRIASQPIVMDSETLNEPQIKNEEFIKQLRDWWGLEASKAVELPNTDKERLSADELRRKYAWFLALYKNPNNEPLKRFKVRVIGTYNNDRDSLLTDWILPATSINEIRNVLGEDGIRVLGGEELPI